MSQRLSKIATAKRESICGDHVSSSSPQVTERIQRIADSYQRLESMLDQVETKIRGDERLSAINDSIVEVEIKVDGRKRKWRARRPRVTPKSSNPKKPR